jgi:hypothetical protein
MIAFAFAQLFAEDGIELHRHQSSNEVIRSATYSAGVAAGSSG